MKYDVGSAIVLGGFLAWAWYTHRKQVRNIDIYIPPRAAHVTRSDIDLPLPPAR